ncbi:MAG: HAD family phosphatase [Bdellovibrionales bacterium]|nr:HAD family phosphatase [Bdellovibrionales bacterium]
MTDLKALVHPKDAIIFDMDGTLVNTEPLHAKAAVLVLADMGVKVDLMACIDQFYGMTDHVVLKTVCPHLSDLEIDKAIEQKNFQLIKLFKGLPDKDKAQFITPGLFPFLQHLKRENKKCAVVSASEDIIVLETLACFGIDPFMELQMGRNQTTLTKPNPDPYLEAMKRLGTHHDHTIIFEDSPTGIKSASSSLAQVVRIMAFAHKTSSQTIEGDYIEVLNFLP